MQPKYKTGDSFKLNGQETEPDYIKMLAVSQTVGDIECEPSDKDISGYIYCYFVLRTTFNNYIYSVIHENFLDDYCSPFVV
ncbi:hypothetical protein [Candidatus Clostridium stratigraminis]|uniref:Uncharacterized protein n=1 Tax=Candidatus Clostridium stratigraminis TaxID=3381661 RepID=A0ABW8T2N9_9CLOT